MEGKLNVLLIIKERRESKIHDYMDKIHIENIHLNQNELKIKKYRDEHCYFIWEKQIMFNFNILLHFSNYLFCCSIQIPIEVIRYILLISLEYEQSLLTCDYNPPCVNQECIIKWWKLSRPKQRRKEKYCYELYPFHCQQCHMCCEDRVKALTTSTECSRCSIVFCFYCPKSIGKKFKYSEFLCKHCIMTDFNQKWPDKTTEQKELEYQAFINIHSNIGFNDYHNIIIKK